MLAASALAIDYILNVAVAISAGVGAVVSAAPALLPYTLPLCLGILAFLTAADLRGVRETGVLWLPGAGRERAVVPAEPRRARRGRSGAGATDRAGRVRP